MFDGDFEKAKRWMRRVVSSFRIRKIDQVFVPDEIGEIRLFMVVRNESLRLPYLLKYYFGRGVDRAFVIDNNSTDDTVSFLLSQKNTHVFQTRESYNRNDAWLDFLLHRYGEGHWCIVADADEMLMWPHWKELSLRELCGFLDGEGYNALHSFVLDMYSDKPVRLTSYEQGGDPLLSACFFDPDSHTKVPIVPCPRLSQKFVVIGGVRKRIFGIEVCLSNFPLVRFGPEMFLSPGTHFIEGASIADIEGATLHFKFLHDFNSRAVEEAEREEHWDNAVEYKAYAKRIRQHPDLNLHYSRSTQFAGSDQLVNFGIMKTSENLDAFVETIVSRKGKKKVREIYHVGKAMDKESFQ